MTASSTAGSCHRASGSASVWSANAKRSRTATGAVLWFNPTTRSAIVLGYCPLAGGRHTFQGDFHPLDSEHDLGPLAGVGEVNNDPVLIAHGGDVTAASQESASADGHVMAAEVLDVGQVVDVADRIGAADACPL